MYKQIHKRRPEYFDGNQSFSLWPLSSMMSSVFNSCTDQEILENMRVLGTGIINYENEFLNNLYDKYSSYDVMDKMFESDIRFFFDFAAAWPKELVNDPMLNQLTRSKQNHIRHKDQSDTIQILSTRNVLMPQLMDTHMHNLAIEDEGLAVVHDPMRGAAEHQSIGPPIFQQKPHGPFGDLKVTVFAGDFCNERVGGGLNRGGAGVDRRGLRPHPVIECAVASLESRRPLIAEKTQRVEIACLACPMHLRGRHGEGGDHGADVRHRQPFITQNPLHFRFR